MTIVACCVVIPSGSKVLAVSRKTDSRDFGLPGGKADDGETLEDAVVRETFEETGITLDRSRLRAVYTAQAGKHVSTCFVCDRYEGTPRSVEAGVVRWIDPARLMSGSFGDYNRAALSAALA